MACDQFGKGVSATTPSSSRTCISGNIFAAIRAGLFQQRKRVAHAAFRHARDDRQRAGVDLQIFLWRRFPERRAVISLKVSARK